MSQIQAQPLINVLAEQRNAAMNLLAQAEAKLAVALPQIERLEAELEDARKRNAELRAKTAEPATTE